MASGNLAADIIHRIAVEPVTRSALAREFELAPSTISAKVNELTEAGLIVEGGAALSRGGRPGKLLTLRYQSGRLGVISMGSRHARVGVADMSRKILSIREVRIDVGQGVDATLDTLWAALRQVAA